MIETILIITAIVIAVISAILIPILTISIFNISSEIASMEIASSDTETSSEIYIPVVTLCNTENVYAMHAADTINFISPFLSMDWPSSTGNYTGYQVASILQDHFNSNLDFRPYAPWKVEYICPNCIFKITGGNGYSFNQSTGSVSIKMGFNKVDAVVIEGTPDEENFRLKTEYISGANC